MNNRYRIRCTGGIAHAHKAFSDTAAIACTTLNVKLQRMKMLLRSKTSYGSMTQWSCFYSKFTAKDCNRHLDTSTCGNCPPGTSLLAPPSCFADQPNACIARQRRRPMAEPDKERHDDERCDRPQDKNDVHDLKRHPAIGKVHAYLAAMHMHESRRPARIVNRRYALPANASPMALRRYRYFTAVTT